ncbi:FHA domain-containing protein [Kribbella sp. NBC_00482]|uniref:FHA domain-containing protein n=1 Tax=Kribbella sp. NBC_00482 TaxID=2975968 RepID=UPI002E18A130
MATVTCSVCKTPGIDDSLLLCPSCQVFLAGVAEEAPVAIETIHEAPVESPSEQTGACPRCGEHCPDDATTCHRCGAPVASQGSRADISSVRLHLPNGGTVGIKPGDVVVIGRDSPDARIADGLERFHGVSREHARLAVRTSEVTLVDLRSTNGTKVDGRAASDVPLSLAPGQHEIRLGKAAVLTVDVLGKGQA